MKNFSKIVAFALCGASFAALCSCNGQKAGNSDNNVVVRDIIPTDAETTAEEQLMPDIQTTPEQEKPDEKTDETPTDMQDNTFGFGKGNKLDFAGTDKPLEYQFKDLYSYASFIPKSKLYDEKNDIWGARIDTVYIGDFNDDNILDMLVGYGVDYDKHIPESYNPKYYDMIDIYTFNADEIQLAREIVCDREQKIEWSVKYNNPEKKPYICNTKYIYTNATRKKIYFYDFFADENQEVAASEEFNEKRNYTLNSEECDENEYLEKTFEYSNFYITQSGGEVMNKAVYFTNEKIEVYTMNFADTPQKTD